MKTKLKVEIATILKSIGSKKCLDRARILESTSGWLTSLHLRDLGLDSSIIRAIANCFEQVDDTGKSNLKSISFSYNNELGDMGAIALAKSLPKLITELGLVDCGITDVGGNEILKWIDTLPNLQMICIEGNKFSDELRLKYESFRANSPRVLVVF